MSGTAPRDGRGPAVRGNKRWPVLSVLLPLAVVVVIFAGVLPRITDYSRVWDLVAGLTWSETALLVVLATANLASYPLVWMAAIPGLGWRRAMLVDQASTAVANTVPVGFAFGVGTTAAMYHSFGYSVRTIARAVALTGIWNNLVKLGMPVVALAGLAVTGQATGAVDLAAALGVLVLLLAIATLVLGLTHRGAAAALAAAGERLAAGPARLVHRQAPAGWVAAIDRFRTDSLALVHRRWARLTASAVASHVALFVLLLACVRLVDGEGSDGNWVRVLAVFSLTRLVTIVPITPGALGMAELSYVAGLTAAGVTAAAAGAAVLVFRFLTWFLPIPVGAAAWLLWRRTTRAASVPPSSRTSAGV